MIFINSLFWVGWLSFPGWGVSQTSALAVSGRRTWGTHSHLPPHLFCRAVLTHPFFPLYLSLEHRHSSLFLICQHLSVSSEKSALLPAICSGRCNYRKRRILELVYLCDAILCWACLIILINYGLLQTNSKIIKDCNCSICLVSQDANSHLFSFAIKYHCR